jgi:hypothetical protein
VLGGDSAVLSQTTAVQPTLAVAELSWNAPYDDNNKVEVQVADGTIKCGLYSCTGSPCAITEHPGESVTGGITGTVGALSGLTFASDGTCIIDMGAFGPQNFGAVYPYASGKVGMITTGATANAAVRNLIVYGH